MKKKVAIQGISGAFHEEAARTYYKTDDIEIIPCATFIDLVNAVESKNADSGIMAIENTVAGAILPNYGLLQTSNLEISGEIYLRIIQNLIALHGTNIENIKEVYSHPMAIYQCNSFFREYPKIRLIESVDTAQSVKDISINKSKITGAIAGKSAAEIYGLNVLEKGIENNQQNYTRFFALELKKEKKATKNKADKASVCFTVPHKTGSLSSVLSVISFYGINLHKIQSHPVIAKPWQYLFYADLAFEDYNRYRQTMEAIQPLTTDLQILGEYKQGKKSFEKIHNSQTNNH